MKEIFKKIKTDSLIITISIVLFVMSYGHGVKSIVCKIKDEEAK